MSMIYELNNEVNLNKICCNICDKQYTRKSSLEKHKILCEFKKKTKREIQVETEEAADIPNHLQLVKIVQELTLKLIKMEEKMEDMQKWVDKKKKKINIVNWLNDNIKPALGFKELVTQSLYVNQNDIENLMINSLHYTFQKIFESQINQIIKSNESPIQSFQQKQNILYIYEIDENDENDVAIKNWRQMKTEDFAIILKTIQHGLIGELSKWKIANKGKFDESDKISDLFNKAIIKLMNLSFTPDVTFSKIRNGLYNFIKINLDQTSASTFEVEF